MQVQIKQAKTLGLVPKNARTKSFSLGANGALLYHGKLVGKSFPVLASSNTDVKRPTIVAKAPDFDRVWHSEFEVVAWNYDYMWGYRHDTGIFSRYELIAGSEIDFDSQEDSTYVACDLDLSLDLPGLCITRSGLHLSGLVETSSSLRVISGGKDDTPGMRQIRHNMRKARLNEARVQKERAGSNGKIKDSLKK